MPDESVSWSGACVDGRASGYGIEVFRYRDKGVWKEERYVGEMQGGKLHGQGTLRADDGVRYDGEFSDGKRSGRGVLTYTDGTRYEGDFQDGQLHGSGSVTFPNGARYVGKFRNGLPDGFGALTRHGETVSGTWSKGCFRGGGRIAAVGVPKERCGASPTAPPADHLIVPGQRIGPLLLKGSIEDIMALFGPGIEKGPTSWPGEGAVLHVWDAAGVWVISDKASGNLLWISIEPNSFARWDTYATTDGLRIGVGESEVVAALGQPERSLDEGGMRSLYYDRLGIRFILGAEGIYAGKVGGIRIVWPSIEHGDMRIVPRERISAISVGEAMDKVLPALGGGYLRTRNPRGDGVYYWPHLGLSLVEHGGRVDAVWSGTNFPDDAANLRYETVDGIGRGGTAAEITRAFGGPDQVRPARRFIKATHWWIYPRRGIAFALDDDQRIRIVDVFRLQEARE